jgi:hypothetical protein
VGHAGSTKRKSRLALRTFNFAIGHHANKALRRESRHLAFCSTEQKCQVRSRLPTKKPYQGYCAGRIGQPLASDTKKLAPTGAGALVADISAASARKE